MTQLYEIDVKLTDNQKTNLSITYKKRETIVISGSFESVRLTYTIQWKIRNL